jgi:hypothetical protein
LRHLSKCKIELSSLSPSFWWKHDLVSPAREATTFPLLRFKHYCIRERITEELQPYLCHSVILGIRNDLLSFDGRFCHSSNSAHFFLLKVPWVLLQVSWIHFSSNFFPCNTLASLTACYAWKFNALRLHFLANLHFVHEMSSGRK